MVRHKQRVGGFTLEALLARPSHVLDSSPWRSKDRPEANLRGCRSASRKVNIVALVRELHDGEPIVENFILVAHLEHALEDIADRVRRVAMIEANVVVLATVRSGIKWPVRVLDRANLVAAVNLPRPKPPK